MVNTANMESSSPPCQVDELISAVRAIKRHPKGYHALHLHFSLLDRAHKQPFHRRLIATAFNKLVQKKSAQLFWTANFDLAFICKDCSLSEIDTALYAALRSIEDSPVIKEYKAAGRDTDLCDWYDLTEEIDQFLTIIETLKNPVKTTSMPNLKSMISNLNLKLSDETAEIKQKIEPLQVTKPLYDSTKKNPLLPMGPMQLDQLERNLINMEMTRMLAKQTAYVVFGESPPQPIFVEHYISVAEVKKALLPQYDILADKWLFQRLTRTFDSKLLQYLPQQSLDPGQVISINLNVETVFSREFDKFLSIVKQKNNQPLILEMKLFDVISDISRYYEARQKLSESGCRITLDTIDLNSLSIMDREILDVDFLKIKWLPEYRTLLTGSKREKIISTINALGKMRIILCHCDRNEALEFGKAAGIHMYQGFLIDKKAAA